MPDAILDMRFAHYLEEFADDEGFLQATHQAGLQVEKKKALKQAREAVRPTGSTRQEEKKKEKGTEKGKGEGDTSRARPRQEGNPAGKKEEGVGNPRSGPTRGSPKRGGGIQGHG